jgi:hypothetical protein
VAPRAGRGEELLARRGVAGDLQTAANNLWAASKSE